MSWDVEALASRLLAAEAGRAAVPPLSDDIALDTRTAYRVQRALERRHRARGARPVGWKLGFTSRVKQIQMGIDQPIFGFLTDRMLRPPGRLSVGELIQPRIEPEIAFRIGADLHGLGMTRDDVLAATDCILPALEILDSRYRDYRFTLPDVVADNTSAAVVVVGTAKADPADVDLITERVALRVGHDERRASGKAVMGDPALAVAWLAGQVALKAGDVVLSGGMTDAVRVRAGESASATFGTLGTLAVEMLP